MRLTLRRSARRLAVLLPLALGCVGERPRDAEADGAAPGERAPSGVEAVEAVDDGGRRVRLDQPARRVVSLLPSATDIMVALGGVGQLAGRTRYDTGPEVAHLPSVGGGLDPSIETLVGLRPDLVITWHGDDRAATGRKLEEAGIRTFALRTEDTTDAFATIERLGRLLGRDTSAARMLAATRAELAAVRRSVADRPPRTVFYVVGTAPPMTAGPQTFITQLVEVAGGRTVFEDLTQPWPTVSIEEVVRRQPDVVVLPVGEDPMSRTDALHDLPGWRDLRAVREGRVVPVDADLMNRPGAHLGRAARTLRDALHPEVRAAPSAGARDSVRP